MCNNIVKKKRILNLFFSIYQGPHPGGGKRGRLQLKKDPLRQSQWVPVGRRQCPSGVLSVGVSESRNTKLKFQHFSILDQPRNRKQHQETGHEVRAIALVTLNPPEFLWNSSSLQLYSIQHRSTVLDCASFFQKSHSDWYYGPKWAAYLHLLESLISFKTMTSFFDFV